MAIDFPNSPTNGQTYTSGTKTWTYDSSRTKWVLSSISPDSGALTTKGDILTRTSSALTRVAVGSNNQVLTADSAQTAGVKWATPLTVATDTLWDAKGDLAVATGADTAAKLTVGTNNYVLTADSSTTSGLKWAASPGVCTSTTRPASPFEGQMIYETDNDLLLVYNGSAWVCLTPKSSTQDASVANPSGTAFAASSGTDPSVTIQTGTKALVTVTARVNCVGNYNFAGVAVSGATTVAASDANSASVGAISAAIISSNTFLLTGLTAGSNTFTMQYRCNVSASGSYDYRKLTVVGVP